MDKFVKLRKIGEGSFGKAYLVKSKTNGEQYVVKEIGIIKMNAREREESRKEVAVLAQLNHPNIVTYRESFEEHGSLFIIMDYCAGGDLYSKISAQRGVLFQEAQVLDWFVQICLALKHIHDRKILHRDIKSQNIFLTMSGRVRLGDFGIAKVLNSTVELARTCIGTPYYLSPEICENKPYNNKSDVWSLGCVLYELATLKHAFESGNMKNLVLKIIRGSYPPISPKYSYDMRGLLAQLFKRSPRDRPSINTILKKPFLRPRIQKFLSDAEFSDEFSHTVMHGVKLKKKLDPSPGGAVRPPVVPARPPSAGRARPPAAGGRYDPAKVYGKPMVRKSKENRASADLKKRPGSAENRRPLPVGPSASLEKRRQELIAREKKRQEEARNKQYEKRHQELVEKQKIARMNRAREEGWKNIISMGSGDSDRGSNRDKVKVDVDRGKLNWPASQGERAGAEQRGKYDQYNAYLDKLEQERQERAAGLAPQQRDYMAAGPVGAHRPGQGMRGPSPVPGVPYPSQLAVRQAQENRVKAEEAAERAKIVGDFLQRKKEAALNRARGQADLFGRPNSGGQQRNAGAQAKPEASPFAARNKEEQEYLQNLRKIRLQNFNERRKLQADLGKNRVDHNISQEERKNKIKALRLQADQRAHELKVNLEREAFERKMKLMENQRQNVAVGADVRMKVVTPAAAAPMTKILQEIGVAVAPAVPQAVQKAESPATQMSREKQAEAIKKNLSENSPYVVCSKWGSPAELVVEAPESARSQWADEHQTLSMLPLEQTSSQHSEDSTPDDCSQPEPPSARRQWGGKAGTVLHALREVKIASATVTLPDDSPGDRPQIGVTQGSSKLFDRVHIFDEDGDLGEDKPRRIPLTGETVTLQSNQTPAQKKQQKSGQMKGLLATGCFDVANAKILRTCSEPDLARLFKTIEKENSFGKCANPKPSRSVELQAGDDDDDDDDGGDEGDEGDEEGVDSQQEEISAESPEGKPDKPLETEDKLKPEESADVDIADVEEYAVNEEEDEDDELLTVRESMASLLSLEADDDDSDRVAFSLSDSDATPRSGTSNAVDGSNNKEVEEETKKAENNEESGMKEEDKTAGGEDTVKQVLEVEGHTAVESAEVTENTDEADFGGEDEDVEENMSDNEECDEDGPAEQGDSRRIPVTFSQLFESDEESDEGDEEEDEYDVFSNLEESRMELEQDLGCEKFLQAYKAVQAVHEDEDEDIEAGTKIALNILGTNHEHLYPKIFQLVMADTAFTEDNM
ncbi:serine/threonine-protein kinase Nek1-like isoform X2 [Liolophura sinensis]|uniref:serine/threonine-protein kinase Nek1-like isoform X2 n=1 Tax=Liolophura sinensis TaxID=3198878 RepID=UPI0031584BA1